MNAVDSQDIHTQSVGIDVSAETLEVRLGADTGDHSFHYTRPKQFSNTQEGYHRMLEWIESESKPPQLLVYYGSDRRILRRAGLFPLPGRSPGMRTGSKSGPSLG